MLHTVQADEDALCQVKHVLMLSWAAQWEGCAPLCIAIFNFSLTTLTSPIPPPFPAFSVFHWKATVWPSDRFESPALQLRVFHGPDSIPPACLQVLPCRISRKATGGGVSSDLHLPASDLPPVHAPAWHSWRAEVRENEWKQRLLNESIRTVY